MEDFAIVIMRKNEDGILSDEVASFEIGEKAVYVEGAYSTLDGTDDMVHIVLSTGKDVAEWEFSAIFDYYDIEKIESLSFIESIVELEDKFNPSWEVCFMLSEDESTLNRWINEIVCLHERELKEVYEEISGKADEYK